MLTTVVRTLGAVSRRVRARNDQLNERREHDAAMRDPGIAVEHHASISRAVADGRPGCIFCS
jgi:hypothetical protein